MFKKVIFLCVLSFFLINCKNRKDKGTEVSEPSSISKDKIDIQKDEINGGLMLPEGFKAIVVADSVGPARHLAVRDNGDIYIKLREETGRYFSTIWGLSQ